MRVGAESITLLLVGVLAGACARNSAAAGDKRLVLTGSSTIAPLMGEIGKRFEAQHPGVRIDVQSGGSSRGVSDVRSDVADIGMASRALREEEQDLFGFTIARDGICVILHAENPIYELDDAQIVAIFKGEITNWKDAGGEDAPITVVNKAAGRSTLELFLGHFQLESVDVKASVVIGDNEQGIKTVAGNPDAIGYVSIGSAEYAATHGVAIRALPLAGIAPSAQNVANGTFPLSRPLTLVTKSEPRGLAREFIDFARSPAVRDLVVDLGFVPLELE